MKYEFDRKLKGMADMDTVNKLVENKVDKEFMDKLIDRINKIEEKAEAKIVKAQAASVEKEESEHDDDDEAKEKSGEDSEERKDEDSPASAKKKKKAMNVMDSEDEARAEEARKKAEEA